MLNTIFIKFIKIDFFLNKLQLTKIIRKQNCQTVPFKIKILVKIKQIKKFK